MPLNSDLENTLEPIVRVLSASLTTTVEGDLVQAYIQGDRELVTWGITKGGFPIAYEGPPMEKAISFAKKHGAKLVTQVDDETKRRLAQTVGDAIKNKRGIPGLARDIRGTFDNMGKYRSQLIARTETASALSQASLDRMEAMGVDGKEWVTVGDDRVSPECQGNEAEGIIPVDQQFSSGVMAPPQHPACRCAVAPGILPVTKAPPKAPSAEPEISGRSANQHSPKDVFGKNADELSVYGDLKDSPEYAKMGNQLSRHISKTTGNKVSSEEAAKMARNVHQYQGRQDIYTKVRSGKLPDVSKNIENYLKYGEKYDGKIYRGMTFSDDVFVNKLKVGSNMDMKGLSSWTTDKKYAGNFASRLKNKVTVELEKGNGVSITHLSRSPLEKEVLLSGTRNLKITSVTQKGDSFYVKVKEI